MTQKQVLKALQDSDRWGCNSQPEINYLAEKISNTNIEGVLVDENSPNGDALFVMFTEKANIPEIVEFCCSMMADEVSFPDAGNDRFIHFWWD